MPDTMVASSNDDWGTFSDDEDPLVEALISPGPTPVEKAREARIHLHARKRHEKRSFTTDVVADGEAELSSVYEDFVYPKLDTQRQQIRLLYVLPSSAELVCSLEVFELDSAPQFSALSYTWGEAEQEHAILVNYSLLVVRKNCWYVLSQARNSRMSLYYWIDAICINQADVEEKSQQVSLMGEIFRKAIRVLACVGPHENGSEQLRAHLSQQRKENQYTIPTAIGDNDMSYKFLARAYWSRVWIIQELLVAAQIYVLCGDEVIPFGQHAWDFLFKMSHATLRRDLFAMIGKDRDKAVGYSLSDLLDVSQTRVCFDERDHIYGVISVMRRYPGLPSMASDYDASTVGVAAAAVYYLDLDECPPLQLHRRLEKLCHILHLFIGNPASMKRIARSCGSLGEELIVAEAMSHRPKCGVSQLVQHSPKVKIELWSATPRKTSHESQCDTSVPAAYTKTVIAVSTGIGRSSVSLTPHHLSEVQDLDLRFSSFNNFGRIAATMPEVVRTGDVLAVVPMENFLGEYSKESVFLLILRQYKAKIYEIVAHAWLKDHIRLSFTTNNGAQAPTPSHPSRYDLYLDPCDLLVHWCLLPELEKRVNATGSVRKAQLLWPNVAGNRLFSYAVAREKHDQVSSEIEAAERDAVAQFASDESARDGKQAQLRCSQINTGKGCQLCSIQCRGSANESLQF